MIHLTEVRMRAYFFLITTIFYILNCYANEEWENCWLQGRDYHSNSQFQEASSAFDQAIDLMSEEDLDKYPYVLSDRAQSDYKLENYSKVLEDTKKALMSKNLTDYERLHCALTRMATFRQLGDEDSSMEEYKKYMIGCPLFPKLDYLENKIVIRNVPDCELYKYYTKHQMLAKYCECEQDIQEYGKTWIINKTKRQNHDLNLLRRDNLVVRGKTPEQIEACVNTCNRLADSAAYCCYLLPLPTVLSGPVTATTCGIACLALVEQLRLDCAECCRYSEEACANKTFRSWKNEFIKENPRCGKPPEKCK